MGRILLALLAAAAACAQTPVTGVRIAGLQPQDWPLGDGGPAVQAALSPLSIAFDRDGSLLIADQMNARLRRLNAGGQISTVFPYSKYGLNTIVAITLDSQGNLYLSDQHIPDLSRLVRIAPDGSMTVLNDLPPQPFAPAVAFDAAGNMYLTDFAANVVWRRSLNGALAKVAGSGKIGTEGEDGPALEASLLGPRRVAFDSQGNLLIADAQRVLRVNPDGTITRLAGGGLMDLEPRSFAPAANGNIYISSGQARIWRWDPNGALSVVAGTGDTSLAFNDGCAASGGVPLAINALVSPYDVVLDGAGRLLFSDMRVNRVRRIDPNGQIHTVAGAGDRPAIAGDGFAIQEILQKPGAIAIAPTGEIYFTEPSANRVREITAAGRLITAMGTDSPPPDQDAACFPRSGDYLSVPGGVALDAKGNLYVADTGNNRILRRARDGSITTIASGLDAPRAIAIDALGNVYFSETDRIRRITPAGVIDSPPIPPGIIAAGADGRLAVTGLGVHVSRGGGPFRQITTAQPGAPVPDPFGSIFFPSGSQIIRLTPNCGRLLYQSNWTGRSVLASDDKGNLYASEDFSIWRVPAIPLPEPDAPAPSIDSTGIRNAASNYLVTESIPQQGFSPPIIVHRPDVIATGEILRITGSCLGPLDPISSQFEQAGVQVTFDGVPASLLSAQSTEILAIVPDAVAGKTSVVLSVRNQGSINSAAPLGVQAVAPGVFVMPGGQAAALNQDSSINSTANPARPGTVVAIYLTGAERVADLGAQVSVGGLSAEVVFAGPAPGLPGVEQVNFRVPDVPPGEQPLKISVGGIGRDQTVTLAVGNGSEYRQRPRLGTHPQRLRLELPRGQVQ